MKAVSGRGVGGSWRPREDPGSGEGGAGGDNTPPAPPAQLARPPPPPRLQRSSELSTRGPGHPGCSSPSYSRTLNITAPYNALSC